MRELVIVVPDFYLPDAERLAAPAAHVLPVLSRFARLGATDALDAGWRGWVARWLGRPALAALPPACVAAAATAAWDGDEVAWLATPVHLVAGLTRVHLDPAGVLRLDAEQQRQLASEAAPFLRDAGARLVPLPGGEFLALGALGAEVVTSEPARWLGRDISAAVPGGADARALRRLGAELEMWLHDHPLNAVRAQAGERRISTLWFWGGGPLSALGAALAAAPAEGAASPPVAFAADPFIEGLWRICGARPHPPHADAAAVLECTAERALVHVPAAVRLDPHTPPDPVRLLEPIEREWLEPALEALGRGGLERVTVLLNDRALQLRSRDRLRIWRRPRSAWQVLQ